MAYEHRRKQPPHYANWVRIERDDYDLELVIPSSPSEPYKIRAKLTPRSTYRFGSESDSIFNLSSMLGNEDGLFWWGRSGFQASGRNFKLDCTATTTGSYILSGELRNLRGEYVPASINIDDKLELVDHTHDESWETFYRLQERGPGPTQRTIVLCFDGTSNHFSEKNTNVVKFMELMQKDDPRQVVYYQTGVGTYSHPGLFSGPGLYVAEQLDKGLAWYLYQHIIDGYKFLMQTYQVGDKIAIIGFSRGAFTARALAGMLHCVGLLPKHNYGKFISDLCYATPPALPRNHNSYHSKDYTRLPPPIDKPVAEILSPDGGIPFPTTGSRPQDVSPADFKRAFCIPVVIDFVGVWDTVASVGAIYSGPALPWVGYNPSILAFRQALALDERRGQFIPSLWDHRYTVVQIQTARDVWFRGEHTDIGGGSRAPSPDEKNPTDPSKANRAMISNITLRWMVRQCFECKSGILFDPTTVELYRKADVLERLDAKYFGGSSNGLYASGLYLSRMGASAMLDEKDVKSNGYAIYDSIGWHPLWNILEILPGSKPTTDKLEPGTTWWPNFKKGRSIYGEDRPNSRFTSGIRIHSSVVEYMMSPEGMDYKPRARLHWNGNRYPVIDDYLGKSELPPAVVERLLA
ncbi:hypothetical protein FRC10_006948 [Ceratobasidium sp. 414]|nr:hypothetical protein FRC10_006948 [Ceratobasidium sp. 414]